MAVPFRQETFTAGELADTLWGRSGVEQYFKGCRSLLNAFPARHGGLVNRAGTRVVREVKDSTKKVRVVAFVFSEDVGQTYELEFGHLYVRVHQAGGTVMAAGVPYEVASPYAEADLSRLRFAQNGDVLTIVHPAYQPRELRRYAHTDWRFAIFTAKPAIAPPAELRPWVAFDQTVGSVLDRWQWVVTSVAPSGEESPPSPPVRAASSDDVTLDLRCQVTSAKPAKLVWSRVDAAAKYRVYKGSGGIFGYIGTASLVTTFNGPLGAQANVTFEDTGIAPNYAIQPPTGRDPFTARAWAPNTSYRSGDVVENGGNVYECTRSGFSAAAGGPAGVGASIDDGATAEVARSTAYAVGQRLTRAGQTYEVVAVALDAKTAAGVSASPFLCSPVLQTVDGNVTWAWKGSGVAAGWRYVGPGPALRPYPAVVEEFEQRLVFAGADSDPGAIWFSGTGQRRTFDPGESAIVGEADPFAIRLASQKRQAVRGLVAAGSLVALTNAGEWAVTGAATAAGVSAANVASHIQAEYGSAPVPAPLRAGEDVLFSTVNGTAVNAAVEARGAGEKAFEILETSFLWSHLLADFSIVEWAWCSDPWRVIWAARSDGLLLSVTYDRKQGIWGAARHQLAAGGVVESMCNVPEAGEDVLYLVAKRTVGGVTKRFIERMESRVVSDVRLGLFLDAAPAVSFDGRNTGATTVKVTGGVAWDAGEQLTVESSADLFALGVGDVGDEIVLQPDAKSGPRAAPGSAAVRLTVLAVTDLRHATVRAEAPVPVAYQGVASTSWAWSRDTMTGLAHLEGEAVTVVADGNVQGPFVVAGGAVALAAPGYLVHAGLAYTSEIELLDVASQVRDIRGQVKAVNRVFVQVAGSRGLQVAESLEQPDGTPTPDELWTDWDVRDVDYGYGSIPGYSGQVELATFSEWNRRGRVALRQLEPFPLHVLAVTREVELGGS
jgi:hypothetical protein